MCDFHRLSGFPIVFKNLQKGEHIEHCFSSRNFAACHVDPGGSFRFILRVPLPLNGHGHRTQENKALICVNIQWLYVINEWIYNPHNMRIMGYLMIVRELRMPLTLLWIHTNPASSTNAAPAPPEGPVSSEKRWLLAQVAQASENISTNLRERRLTGSCKYLPENLTSNTIL